MVKQYKNVSPGGNPYTNWQKTTALKELRKTKGIASTALAEAIGVSKTKMSDVENGIAYISPERLEQIAIILDTDIESISKGIKTVMTNKVIKGRS